MKDVALIDRVQFGVKYRSLRPPFRRPNGNQTRRRSTRWQLLGGEPGISVS